MISATVQAGMTKSERRLAAIEGLGTSEKRTLILALSPSYRSKGDGDSWNSLLFDGSEFEVESA